MLAVQQFYKTIAQKCLCVQHFYFLFLKKILDTLLLLYDHYIKVVQKNTAFLFIFSWPIIRTFKICREPRGVQVDHD
jgi:hypothetical protein